MEKAIYRWLTYTRNFLEKIRNAYLFCLNLSHSYQNICNLIGYEDVNIRRYVQGAQYDNIALQCKYEKKIQNG